MDRRREPLAESKRSRLVALVVVGAGVGALLVHISAFYRVFFFDDSYITLRYARRFLDGHGLTWNDGERVEGYSNPLWLLLVAGVSAITRANLVAVARVLGLVCTGAGMLAVATSARSRNARGDVTLALVVLSLSAAGPVAAWAVGGLEAPLLSALAAAGAVLTYPLLESERGTWSDVVLPGALLGLCAWTRPDGILFALGAALGLAAARADRGGLCAALRLLALPSAAVALELTFRRAYYGDWVPNTYYAKVAFTRVRFFAGLRYVFAPPGPTWLFALLPFSIVASVKDSNRRKRVVLSSAMAALWAAYVASLGGDIAPERRHVVPLFFLLALPVLEGLLWCAERATSAATLAPAAAAAAVGSAVYLQWEDGERGLMALVSTDSGRFVGRFLSRAFGAKRPLVAVDAAGAVPYYSGLPALDMLGLSDRYLATHRPRDFGQGWLAHELGDGAYFLRRKPDLVLFHEPPGQTAPIWRGGREMARAPEFRSLYKVVTFDTGERDGKSAVLWARVEDGRIGIERGRERVTVPGFLLSDEHGPAANLGDDGKLGIVLDDRTAGVIGLRLDPGGYRLEIDSDGQVDVSIASGHGGDKATGPAPIDFHVAAERASTVSVAVTASERVTVRELAFVRTE